MGNKQSTLVINDTPVATVQVKNDKVDIKGASDPAVSADANNNTPVNGTKSPKLVKEGKIVKNKHKNQCGDKENQKQSSSNGCLGKKNTPSTSKNAAAATGAKNRKCQKPWLNDLKLNIEKVVPEDIIEKVENKVRDVQNSYLLQRRLITTPLWRESVTSLKPTDNIYKVSTTLYMTSSLFGI